MKKQSGRVITTLAGGTLALVLALGSANPAFAASGKVKYSSRVRQSADSNSKAIGSFSKDATVDLLSQVTDANGQVWYQVNVVGGTGYIRGDLVSTTDTVPKASGTGSASTTSTQSAASTQTTTSSGSGNFNVTDTGSKEAYISAGKNCNIRSGPGVSYSSQGTLSNGSSLTITGETTASDGKKYNERFFCQYTEHCQCVEHRKHIKHGKYHQ